MCRSCSLAIFGEEGALVHTPLYNNPQMVKLELNNNHKGTICNDKSARGICHRIARKIAGIIARKGNSG